MHRYSALSLITLAVISSTGPVRAENLLLEQLTVRGAYESIGNVYMDCVSNCGAHNSAPFKQLDIDADATTTNSTSSTLALPPGATVKRAFLIVSAFGYYGAWAPTTVDASAVLFKGPSDVAYSSLLPAYRFNSENRQSFQAIYDVTSLVTGDGEYTVANAVVPPSTLIADWGAVWVMVTVYEQPAAPVRLVQIYTGNANDTLVVCGSSTMTASGFLTPASGPVDGQLTFFALDANTSTSYPDSIYIGAQTLANRLSNAQNPINNPFNSSFSLSNGDPIVRNPSVYNSSGENADIDTFTLPPALFGNGQNTVTATFNCPHSDGTVVLGSVLSFRIQAPLLSVTKSASDVNGGELVPGEQVEFTLAVAHAAGSQEDAANVVISDAIPGNLAYVANSLSINGNALTDASDTDAGTVAGQSVSVNISALPLAGQAVIKFRVQTSATPSSAVNVASVTYTGVTSNVPIDSESNPAAITWIEPTCADAVAPGDEVCSEGTKVVYAIVNLAGGSQGTVRCLQTGSSAPICDTLPDGTTLKVYPGLYCSAN